MRYRLDVRATRWLAPLLVCWLACTTTDRPAHAKEPRARVEASGETREASDEAAREQMVEKLAAEGIGDERVLNAMRRVPRHELVPPDVRSLAYEDEALPIGYGQTISAPSVVALMTSLLELDPKERVLEVGTGSGYQTAVLAALASEVYSVEIVEPLATRAARDLARLGVANAHVKHGDGYEGWAEHAPYDAIIVTAAAPYVPEPLAQQLAMGGRLVIPVGDGFEELRIITRTPEGLTERSGTLVQFVPMTGRVREKRRHP